MCGWSINPEQFIISYWLFQRKNRKSICLPPLQILLVKIKMAICLACFKVEMLYEEAKKCYWKYGPITSGE